MRRPLLGAALCLFLHRFLPSTALAVDEVGALPLDAEVSRTGRESSGRKPSRPAPEMLRWRAVRSTRAAPGR
ncbi:hypothetical protein [uncultured Celeribacter sp.]|uniref:hypothetical protein n=1 Tax=uncultured Celeribacter sp. TaxID=1303376 RepID=UPI002AA87FEA|nr:hypothetical protein [uncultured Celeribacter sp.]